jgi:hypothetical protein
MEPASSEGGIMKLFDRRRNFVMRGNVKLAIRLGSIFGSDASAEFMVSRQVPNHVVLRALTAIS